MSPTGGGGYRGGLAALLHCGWRRSKLKRDIGWAASHGWGSAFCSACSGPFVYRAFNIYEASQAEGQAVAAFIEAALAILAHKQGSVRTRTEYRPAQWLERLFRFAESGDDISASCEILTRK